MELRFHDFQTLTPHFGCLSHLGEDAVRIGDEEKTASQFAKSQGFQ
jgi:hypothetical protein